MAFEFVRVPKAKDLVTLANYLSASEARDCATEVLAPIREAVAARLRCMADESADSHGDLTDEAKQRYQALRLFVK